ncbi:MAG: membrane dipeptidase [Bacteroidetes bacterium]|jgi:membrane dipeptidase|nr:membrane dipeptidase [Bacteroidota bacterium]
MRALPLLALLLLPLMLTHCRTAPETETDDALRARADSIAQRHIIVDGHIDVPYRLTNYEEDITQATETGDFDYPRARAGGLDAPFMSIYLPARLQDSTGAAKALADSLIDMVEGFAERAPDKFAMATSPDDVRRHVEQGLISLPMGMENGAGIEGDLANLQHFYDRGIRYITLTHAKDNRISDSSYDTTYTHGGLSAFGEDVVREMNRLGMIVDVSHITDSAFYDVMRVTEAPVLATHSSARAFTPDWERNMSDDLIQRLAENGGVIMINFGSSFLRSEYQEQGDTLRQQIGTYLEEHGLERDAPEAIAYYAEQRKQHPIGTVEDVADHIDHVVDLVGVDYVGLGSDFDGVFALPEGLSDASHYPNLIAELLRRDYTEDEIAQILGGNALRVWEEVEQVARSMQAREAE